jgi:hypothetical protein
MNPMTNDDYLQSQIMAMLLPGEQVLHSAYMRRQPGLMMQMFVVGGLLLILLTKSYYVVLTNRRLILIRTKMRFWSGGPKQVNLGVEQWDVRNLARCTTGGFANNKSMTFELHQGGKQTLRVSPWGKTVRGTREFFDQVPGLINGGQVQQLAAGAPALPMLPAGAPPSLQPAQPPAHALPAMQVVQPRMYVAQPVVQQPQMQHQALLPAGALGPGSRVLVAAPDGQRYPATIVQIQQGQYLCAMPNGQSYWFAMQQVTPA